MKRGADKELLIAVEKWVARVGRNKAMALLMEKGVGTTTAERLTSGRYDNRPGPMLKTALADLVNDQVVAS